MNPRIPWRPGPERVSPPAPGPAPPQTVPRAPNTAPRREPYQLARGWTGQAITDTSAEVRPFAWRGFTTGQAPAPIQQSWTQNLLQSTLGQAPAAPLITAQYALPVQPARLQQSWSSPAITDTSQEVRPFAWTAFQVPQRAAELARGGEWSVPVPILAKSTPPFGAQSGGLGKRGAVEPLRTWTQNLLESTLAPVTSSPIQSNEFAALAARPYLPYGWQQSTPLPLSQSLVVTYVLRAPMQAPMARHYERDRSYLSFECLSYADVVPALETLVRMPLQAPRRIAEPHRLRQGWDQETPLALRSQFVTLRAPMEAPDFHAQLLAWRQAWNPNNLLPQQSATPPTVRYHVIGSFIVRRYK